MDAALIDPQGRICSADSPGLREQFGTELSGSILGRFLSQNMGWISLRCTSHEATIACRPGRITGEAITAAAYFLADKKISHAILPSVAAPSKRQRIIGLSSIVAALEQLAFNGHLMSSADHRYLQRPAPLSATPFRLICEQLSTNGVLSRPLNGLVAACNLALKGRFTLATSPEPGKPVRIAHIGTSYTHFRPAYYSRAIGLGFEDSPDINYGRWIAGTMKESLSTLSASFGEVDAEVRVFGKGHVRIRYDRMILPFIGADGQRYVLSASQMRDNIDLRKEAV